MAKDIDSEPQVSQEQEQDADTIFRQLTGIGQDDEETDDESEEESGEEYEDDDEPEESDGEDEAEEEACDTCENPVMEFIKEQFGEDLSQYKNDYELLKGLVNARKLVGQRSAEAQMLNALRARYGDEFLNDLLEGRASGAGAGKQQAAPADALPEFDESWLSQVARDENGNLVALPGADKSLPEKIIKFAKHREKLLNDFAKNPREFVKSLIGEDVANITATVLSEGIRKASSQAAIQDFAAQHKDVLFQKGDPDAGLTEFGEMLANIADSAMGITDPHQALQFAFEVVKTLGQGQVKTKSTAPAQPATYHTPRKANKKKQMTIEDYIEKGYSLVEAYNMVNK